MRPSGTAAQRSQYPRRQETQHLLVSRGVTLQNSHVPLTRATCIMHWIRLWSSSERPVSTSTRKVNNNHWPSGIPTERSLLPKTVTACRQPQCTPIWGRKQRGPPRISCDDPSPFEKSPIGVVCPLRDHKSARSGIRRTTVSVPKVRQDRLDQVEVRIAPKTFSSTVSYTHLTLPTICSV